ncbi:probable salivary secreted peptide [Leptopilina heterotoma]|uniref:probable salivary secreted peptide n=1 Tax=Leptopilina heterotoma TaxID=63436 RepID=UPI001CA7D5EF|nr:probable salivary secreted peptide [Leptopilina heterotoma]
MKKTLDKFIFTIIIVILLSMNSWEIANGDGGNAAKQSVRCSNLIVGTRSPSDKLLWRINVNEPPQSGQYITINKRFNVDRILTQVSAYNQSPNNICAFPSLIGGGPGFKYVELRFVSQRSRGVDFLVLLYVK